MKSRVPNHVSPIPVSTTYVIGHAGRITIPKHIRDHLGVVAGDKLDFTITKYGHLEVRAAAPPTSTPKTPGASPAPSTR